VSGSGRPFLHVEDVMQRYGCSRSTVHHLTGDRAIPFRHFPHTRRCLFLEPELEQWDRERWEPGGCELEVKELPYGGIIVRPKVLTVERDAASEKT
jgi:predicted DNA-binding transcriptional regulator AlpA